MGRRKNNISKQIQNQLTHNRDITEDYMRNKMQRYKAQPVLRKPERLLTSKFIILCPASLLLQHPATISPPKSYCQKSCMFSLTNVKSCGKICPNPKASHTAPYIFDCYKTTLHNFQNHGQTLMNTFFQNNVVDVSVNTLSV